MRHWPSKTHNKSRNPNTKPPPHRLIQASSEATLTLPTGRMHYTTALLSGEATSEALRPTSTSSQITPRMPAQSIFPIQCPMCFTMCLFISPDLNGHRAPKNRARYVFTICLFISPDLDGHRASLTLRDPENCKVPIPKYEAAVLHVHLSTGYPN